MPPAGRRVAGIVLAAALLVAACGDSVAGTNIPATTAAPDVTATTTAAAAGSALPAGFDIQGHRGARGLRPENTLPAFEIALDLGVSTLELDLHFTADDRVIVWHDPVIDPDKCGLGDGASGPDPDDPLTRDDELRVRALTLAQIDAYRCDRNPGGFPAQVPEGTAIAGDDFGIVTLGELFDFVAAYSASDLKTAEQRAGAEMVQFNIETKRRAADPGAIGDGFDGTAPGPFELAVLAEVEGRNLVDRVAVQSFDHRSIWAIRAVNAEIRLVALTNRDRPRLDEYVSRGASVWSPRHSELDSELLEQAHNAGLEVIPWTVNEPAVMLALIELGVDGLITDRPDLALALP